MGASYALVGVFVALLLWIWPTPAGTYNGAPTVRFDSIVTAVSWVARESVGPLNAVGIIGGGMLIAGVAVIARSLRERSGSSVPR